MNEGFEVIDSHIHFFLTSSLIRGTRGSAVLPPETVARMRERFDRNLRERGEPAMDTSASTPEEYAARWLAELDGSGVAQAVFLTLNDVDPAFERFISLHPDRFIGYGHLDPRDPGAPAAIERMVTVQGYKGVKLITTTQWFHAYDPACYPFYRKAEELGVPVLVHCGVSIGYTADFRYANPLDLQPVLRDFPGLNILLAHFGAGFFREALLLCYQCPNLYLDTSSSNIWMKYQDHPMTIRDVFARALDAAGANRLVFGTDSSYFPRGFRKDILHQQAMALEDLGVAGGERAAIFGGNLRRLLKME